MADQVAKYSGLLWACERRMRSSVTVLTYHRVLEDEECEGYPFPSLVMPRSLFEAQLDYVSQHARVLPLLDALRGYGDRPRDSPPLVCLTFDDGYVDSFEIVAPLLESRGLRGTFFITAGAVQARKALWYDQAAHMWGLVGGAKLRDLTVNTLGNTTPAFDTRESWIEWLKIIPNRRRTELFECLDAELSDCALACSLMTSAQVRLLVEQGHEIGSHTLQHPILTTMEDEERRREIAGSRQLLQDWTHQEVSGFCYPNGDFDAAIIRQLRDAGHEYACTTLPGRNDKRTDRFALHRINVTADRVANTEGSFDMMAFRAEISMLHEALRRGS